MCFLKCRCKASALFLGGNETVRSASDLNEVEQQPDEAAECHIQCSMVHAFMQRSMLCDLAMRDEQTYMQQRSGKHRALAGSRYLSCSHWPVEDTSGAVPCLQPSLHVAKPAPHHKVLLQNPRSCRSSCCENCSVEALQSSKVWTACDEPCPRHRSPCSKSSMMPGLQMSASRQLDSRLTRD